METVCKAKPSSRSKTFAKTGLEKIRALPRRERAFAVAKVCMELGKRKSARAAAAICVGQCFMEGRFVPAARVSRKLGISENEAEAALTRLVSQNVKKEAAGILFEFSRNPNRANPKEPLPEEYLEGRATTLQKSREVDPLREDPRHITCFDWARMLGDSSPVSCTRRSIGGELGTVLVGEGWEEIYDDYSGNPTGEYERIPPHAEKHSCEIGYPIISFTMNLSDKEGGCGTLSIARAKEAAEMLVLQLGKLERDNSNGGGHLMSRMAGGATSGEGHISKLADALARDNGLHPLFTDSFGRHAATLTMQDALANVHEQHREPVYESMLRDPCLIRAAFLAGRLNMQAKEISEVAKSVLPNVNLRTAAKISRFFNIPPGEAEMIANGWESYRGKTQNGGEKNSREFYREYGKCWHYGVSPVFSSASGQERKRPSSRKVRRKIRECVGEGDYAQARILGEYFGEKDEALLWIKETLAASAGEISLSLKREKGKREYDGAEWTMVNFDVHPQVRPGLKKQMKENRRFRDVSPLAEEQLRHRELYKFKEAHKQCALLGEGEFTSRLDTFMAHLSRQETIPLGAKMLLLDSFGLRFDGILRFHKYEEFFEAFAAAKQHGVDVGAAFSHPQEETRETLGRIMNRMEQDMRRSAGPKDMMKLLSIASHHGFAFENLTLSGEEVSALKAEFAKGLKEEKIAHSYDFARVMGSMGISEGTQIHNGLKQIYDAHQEAVKKEREARIASSAARAPAPGFAGPRYGPPAGMDYPEYVSDDSAVGSEDSCGGD